MRIVQEIDSDTRVVGWTGNVRAGGRYLLFQDGEGHGRMLDVRHGHIATRFVDEQGQHHFAELAVDLNAAADKAWAGVQLVDTLRALRAWRKGWFELQARQCGFPEAAINAAIWRSMETGRPISMERVNGSGDLQLYVGAELVHTVQTRHPGIEL